jgi:hypothetical protein
MAHNPGHFSSPARVGGVKLAQILIPDYLSGSQLKPILD